MLRNRWFQIFGGLLVVGIILYILGVKLAPHDIRISAAAEPLWCLGGERIGEHCSETTFFPVTNSLVMTLLADLLLILTIVFGARNMKLVPQGFQNVVEAAVEALYNFSQSIDRKNIAKFFPVTGTIFFFFLYANFIALIPGVGSIGICTPHANEGSEVVEIGHVAAHPLFSNLSFYCGGDSALIPWLRAPAADLNVTVAFALVAVIMVEVVGVQALGLGYFTKFFNFREGFMGAFVGIIELISELARILAFAFRIFGNIFAGEVILIVMSYLFPYLLPLPFYGLEVFVAFIQAFIFSVLTLVFMSIAVIGHGGHDDHGSEEAHALEAAGHGASH